MSGHTPGPWRVVVQETWPFDMSIVAAGGTEVFYQRRIAHATNQKTLADCRSARGFSYTDRENVIAKIEQQEADTALAAAAPELLEALENLLAVNEGQGGTRYHAQDIARAAIAKAKDTPNG